MREMVLDRDEGHSRRIYPEIAQERAYSSYVAPVPTISVDQAMERTRGRVPVAAGVMPACRTQETDFCVRNRDDIDIARLKSGVPQAELSGVKSEPAFRMFLAHEAFFLRGGDEFAVNQKSGGGIVINDAGQTEDDQVRIRIVASLRNVL